jgi:hypothetical protein
MKIIIRWITLLSVLATLVGTASASLDGSIAGTVVDQGEQPLPGVVVTIVNSTSGYSATKVTDIDGAFTAGNLQPATYTLTLTLPGFALLKKEVQVLAGRTVHPTYVMTASP